MLDQKKQGSRRTGPGPSRRRRVRSHHADGNPQRGGHPPTAGATFATLTIHARRFRIMSIDGGGREPKGAITPWPAIVSISAIRVRRSSAPCVGPGADDLTLAKNAAYAQLTTVVPRPRPT